MLQGVHYAYRDDSAPVLTAASNEQVTLILPEHMKVKHGARGRDWRAPSDLSGVLVIR